MKGTSIKIRSSAKSAVLIAVPVVIQQDDNVKQWNQGFKITVTYNYFKINLFGPVLSIKLIKKISRYKHFKVTKNKNTLATRPSSTLWDLLNITISLEGHALFFSKSSFKYVAKRSHPNFAMLTRHVFQTMLSTSCNPLVSHLKPQTRV